MGGRYECFTKCHPEHREGSRSSRDSSASPQNDRIALDSTPVIPAQAGIQFHDVSPNIAYCRFMEEIKIRLNQVWLVQNTELLFHRDDFAYEFVAIQFRKILELIAFSSLTANKEKYAQLHKVFETHWHAERILKDLDKINPEFYPKPTSVSKTGDNTFHAEHAVAKNDGVDTPLTRLEFAFLYEVSGKTLHVPKPFQDNFSIDFKYHPSVWAKKIALLLDTHMIKLVDDGGYWLVMMNGGGKAHAYTLSPPLHVGESMYGSPPARG